MRWVLNEVPAWALALIFIVGMTAVCLGGFLLVHRLGIRSPSTGMDTMVSAFSGKATALFGILLVFVIVAEFNHFNETKSGVAREASALAQIDRDSGPFPTDVRQRLRDDAGAYARAVVYDEWPLLRRN